MPTVTETLGRARGALGWLVAAALLAFGSAGIVAATSPEPGRPARADLTWAADQAARRELDGARADLQALADDVEGLGQVARGAIAALSAHDGALLQTAIDDGTARAAAIESDAVAIQTSLEGMSQFGPGAATRLSRALIDEHDSMLAAVKSTAGLETTWSGLAEGALAADALTSLLLDHDAIVGNVAALGRDNKWQEALQTLDGADALMIQAGARRDALAQTAEVTTLDEWLARNRRYDAALRVLYTSLIESGGRVSDAVRAAYAEEGAARAALPPDTRGLVLIVAEAGRGGLNDAVIEIENLRGRLFEALAAASTPVPVPG